MGRIEDINNEIEQLEKQLDSVQGKPTEVYTRIVGYYRSVKNWNKGKREEYRHRKQFRREYQLESVEKATSRRFVPDLSSDSKDLSYRYFFRKNCPNCPPVAAYLEESGLRGEKIDVDQPEGLEQARQEGVLATPTVILLNAEGKELFRGNSRDEVREVLEPAHVT